MIWWIWIEVPGMWYGRVHGDVRVITSSVSILRLSFLLSGIFNYRQDFSTRWHGRRWRKIDRFSSGNFGPSFAIGVVSIVYRTVRRILNLYSLSKLWEKYNLSQLYELTNTGMKWNLYESSIVARELCIVSLVNFFWSE